MQTNDAQALCHVMPRREEPCRSVAAIEGVVPFCPEVVATEEGGQRTPGVGARRAVHEEMVVSPRAQNGPEKVQL